MHSATSRPLQSSGAVLAVAFAAALAAAADASAQQIVFDPKAYAESVVHTAHQLESLTNQARMLANQARELAASPYSHLAESSQALRDIGALAQSARGVAADVAQLQSQLDELYPTTLHGLDPLAARSQSQARNALAGETAADLARAAAELDRLSQSRPARLSGALAASEQATGETAAMQSATQVLAVLAEDLASTRAILLAQARLSAEEAARRAADRAAADDAHRRLWAHEPAPPPNPAFDPLPHARR
jgi:P-type conjugative transfer protein TrbJ